MINKLFKALSNSALLVILLALLIVPISSMGIMKYQENPVVLSATDQRDTKEEVFFDDKDVPEEIEEVIRRLEEEYYQKANTVPSETNPNQE